MPLGAVQRMGEVARVFVVRDGVAREQVVALGEVERGKVEIRRLTGRRRWSPSPSWSMTETRCDEWLARS